MQEEMFQHMRTAALMGGGAIMPIGLIEESNDNGGIMTLTRPNLSHTLTCETPILIANEYQGASAFMSGFITEISGTTASFHITSVKIDPNWPAHLDPKGAGMGVYLEDGRGQFMPSMTMWASPGEVEMLIEFATKHQEETGIDPTVGIITEIAIIENGPNEMGGPIE